MISLSRIVRSAILMEAADDRPAKSVAIAIKARELLMSDPGARQGDPARRRQAQQMLDSYVAGAERDPQVLIHLRELEPYTSIESVAMALQKFYKGTTPPTRWPLSAMTVLGDEHDPQSWPPYLEEIVAKTAFESAKTSPSSRRSSQGDVDISPEALSADAPLRDVEPYDAPYQRDPDTAPERETGLAVSRAAPSIGSLGDLRSAFRTFSTAFIRRFDDSDVESGVDQAEVVEQIRVIDTLFSSASQMTEGRSRSILYLAIFEGLSPFGLLGRALSGGSPDIQPALTPPPAAQASPQGVAPVQDKPQLGTDEPSDVRQISPKVQEAYNTFIEQYSDLKPRLEDEAPDVAGEILSEIDTLVGMFETHFGIEPEEM